MIRHLCPPPTGPWSPASLHDLALTRWPSTRAVNEVNDDGPKVALYLPDGTTPTAEDLAAWEADVAAWVEPPAEVIDPVVVAAETIQTEVDARLAPSGVNSIAEVKTAIRDGLAAAVATLRGTA